MKQLIVFFVLAFACQLSAAPVTNVVSSAGVGDVSVVCSDASGWNFSSSVDRADGREVVTARSMSWTGRFRIRDSDCSSFALTSVVRTIRLSAASA